MRCSGGRGGVADSRSWDRRRWGRIGRRRWRRWRSRGCRGLCFDLHTHLCNPRLSHAILCPCAVPVVAQRLRAFRPHCTHVLGTPQPREGCFSWRNTEPFFSPHASSRRRQAYNSQKNGVGGKRNEKKRKDTDSSEFSSTLTDPWQAKAKYSGAKFLYRARNAFRTSTREGPCPAHQRTRAQPDRQDIPGMEYRYVQQQRSCTHPSHEREPWRNSPQSIPSLPLFIWCNCLQFHFGLFSCSVDPGFL